jgi:CheY-specific phosphatase CheX
MEQWRLVVDALAAVAATGAVISSLMNFRKINELHILVNSRLTELLTVTAAAARAEGHEAGRVEQIDTPPVG